MSSKVTFQRFMCRYGWLLALGGAVLGWFSAPTSEPFLSAFALPAVVLMLVAGSAFRRRRASRPR